VDFKGAQAPSGEEGQAAGNGFNFGQFWHIAYN
jgi:hypothetical protein